MNWLTTSTGASDVGGRLLVAQDPQPPDLPGHPGDLGGAVVVGDAEQHQQARPVDRADDLPVNSDGCRENSLDYGAHRQIFLATGSTGSAKSDTMPP